MIIIIITEFRIFCSRFSLDWSRKEDPGENIKDEMSVVDSKGDTWYCNKSCYTGIPTISTYTVFSLQVVIKMISTGHHHLLPAYSLSHLLHHHTGHLTHHWQEWRGLAQHCLAGTVTGNTLARLGDVSGD